MTEIPSRFSNGVDLRYLESPEAHNLLHKRSDLNNGVDAQHHSLGTQPYQAAAGNHGHWSEWKDFAEVGVVPASGVQWYGAPWQSMQFRRNLTDGLAHSRGFWRATSGVAASGVVFTLPEGWRVPAQDIFYGWSDTGGVQQFVRYDMYPNGQVLSLTGLGVNAAFSVNTIWSIR